MAHLLSNAIRKIKVKILRKFYLYETLELILVDEKGQKIHAVINKEYEDRRTLKIVEGNWISITNFDLVPVTGAFRPVPHRFKIVWNSGTTIKDIRPLCSADFFSFVAFEDIKSGSLDPTLCVDLIGRLMCVGNYDEDEGMNSTWEQIYLELENVRGIRIRCRLPKGYATKFFSCLKTCADNIILCVMRFARLELSRGDMRATTLCTCTELLFNPSCDEASRMRLAFASVERKLF
ncbi:predicted protein [Arabidopsis lyrata subsp. lyrata]|uniref:Predicted protein n=1 Tax=Arabidopsis lyrata subsp. lyrata TaxID=81972 RepID=D7MVG9_ARALL|nr:predicted protein [Arabidopsis lyrata subsp. lyrata]